ETYFLDPAFQERFARHHLNDIVTRLKDEWAGEYDEFMQKPGLESYAELSMPYVLKWFEARIKMVQLAECMNMDALPPAPEKKSSPMRLQEKRTEKIIAMRPPTHRLLKQAFHAGDKIALAAPKPEKILKSDA